MAEIIMLLFMLLFVALCAVILGLAIYEVYGRKNGAQTNQKDQNTCA